MYKFVQNTHLFTLVRRFYKFRRRKNQTQLAALHVIHLDLVDMESEKMMNFPAKPSSISKEDSLQWSNWEEEEKNGSAGQRRWI